MKLKTTKRILLAILGLIVVLVILMGITKTPALGYAAIGCLVPYFVILVIFWRCPGCGKCLYRLDVIGKSVKYCPYCGEELVSE